MRRFDPLGNPAERDGGQRPRLDFRRAARAVWEDRQISDFVRSAFAVPESRPEIRCLIHFREAAGVVGEVEIFEQRSPDSLINAVRAGLDTSYRIRSRRFYRGLTEGEYRACCGENPDEAFLKKPLCRAGCRARRR